MRWWFDVGDLLAHFARHRAPSGVQRVVLSLLAELRSTPQAPRLRLLRVHRRGVAEVPFAALPGYPSGASDAALPASRVAALARRLPDGLRAPLRRGYHAAGAAAARVAGALAGYRDEVAPQAGDWLVVAGAGWSRPDHARHLVRLVRAHSLRLALVVHDLIPALRPRWNGIGARSFERWLAQMLDCAERVATVSRHTRADLEAFARRRGIRMPVEVATLRLGEELPAVEPAAVPGLAPPFALCVGTLEARKNQRLLVEVWQHLAAQQPRGAAALPRLVLAGRLGVGGKAVLRNVRRCRGLDGRIRWYPELSDAQLAWAYREAAFTVVPSRYEGWGLPVAESLAHETPCLAAAATSLPEVGEHFADYFAPDDVADCAEKVRAYAFEPAALERARARLRTRVPHTWGDTAAQLTAWLARES